MYREKVMQIRGLKNVIVHSSVAQYEELISNRIHTLLEGCHIPFHTRLSTSTLHTYLRVSDALSLSLISSVFRTSRMRLCASPYFERVSLSVFSRVRMTTVASDCSFRCTAAAAMTWLARAEREPPGADAPPPVCVRAKLKYESEEGRSETKLNGVSVRR